MKEELNKNNDMIILLLDHYRESEIGIKFLKKYLFKKNTTIQFWNFTAYLLDDLLDINLKNCYDVKLEFANLLKEVSSCDYIIINSLASLLKKFDLEEKATLIKLDNYAKKNSTRIIILSYIDDKVNEDYSPVSNVFMVFEKQTSRKYLVNYYKNDILENQIIML